MKKLGVTGQKWLKSFHVLFGCIWVGCAVALVVLMFTFNASHDRELFGIMDTMDFIDLFVLVPAAIGTLLTSLIYSIWTKWGWFKYNWITVKWIICVFGIVFGTFALGPWLSEMAHISDLKGLEAFSDSDYLTNMTLQSVFGTLQAGTIVLAVFLSILKPWKSKGK